MNHGFQDNQRKQVNQHLEDIQVLEVNHGLKDNQID